MLHKIKVPEYRHATFDLPKLLDGTQDFRWRPLPDGWHSGVLDGHIVHLRQSDDTLEYRAHTDVTDLLTCYFRLDEDIDSIFATLSSLDPHIACLIRMYPHLRVLRQPDPWECTVAYICSANNSIEGIANIVEKTSCAFGKVVKLEDDVRYTFPTPESIFRAGSERLQALGLGLPRRPEYILSAARRVHDRKLNLQHLARPDIPYKEAERQLRQCPGVGPKISACISLFSLDKPQAFPIDTHIRSTLRKAYPVKAVREAYPAESTRRNERRDDKLATWAQSQFGEYAGWAGQLLFQSRSIKRRP